MLALDPNALVSTSPEVNPGMLDTGPYQVGEFNDARFINQAAYREKPDGPPGPVVFMATPHESVFDYFDDQPVSATSPITPLMQQWHVLADDLSLYNILRPGTVNTSQYDVFRNLHVTFPADPADPNKLAGSGPLPLAVLVHGQHFWNVPNYRGYLYLQNELASRGIVSVSVDTNGANCLHQYIQMRAEMVLGAIDALYDMATDPASPFHGRIDFDNVGLMGHSRGGDAVVRAAIINAHPAARALAKINRKYGIKTVCSLSPTDFTTEGATFVCNAPTSLGPGANAVTSNALDRTHCEFYAVIYGALDSDVKSIAVKWPNFFGTGFGHYDRARTDKAMIFLDACNHNRFNDVWDADDYGTPSEDLPRLVSRQGHRDLLMQYVAGLFRWQLLGDADAQYLFDGTQANAVMAGAAIQWSFGSKVVSLDDMEGMPPTGSTRGPAGVLVGEMATMVSATGLVGQRTCHLTGVLHASNLGVAPLQVYTLTFASPQNWSAFDQFIFRVCADANTLTAATTAASLLPDFTLIFTDVAPQSAQVAAASLRSSTRPRPPMFHQMYTAIRMETFAVDLAGLSGVDLTQISKIEITVPGIAPVDQFFDSFELVTR